MDNQEILPGIEKKQGYTTFCKNYLKYRDDVGKECEKRRKDAERANDVCERIQKEMADYPDAIRIANMNCSQQEREVDALLQEIQQVGASEADVYDLAQEENNEIQEIKKKYQIQKGELKEIEQRLKNAREENKTYLDLLQQNRDFYKRVLSYKEMAAERVARIKKSFPSKASQIQNLIDGPLVELTSDDRHFEKCLQDVEDVDGVYNPLKLMETINYVINPGMYPYPFLSKSDFLFMRVLIIIVLAAGIFGGFAVHPILNPLSVVLSLLLVRTLVSKNNRRITEKIDWKELRIYHMILSLEEGDAERLARKAVNLPNLSAEEYQKKTQKELASMENQLPGLRADLARRQEEINANKRQISQLQTEWEEIQEPAQKANSRLYTALQKQRNGMELTENQAFLIHEYNERVSDWNNRRSGADRRIEQLSSSNADTRQKIQSLEQKIDSLRKTSRITYSRLLQIESLTDGGKNTIEQQLSALEREEQAEINQLKQAYIKKRKNLEIAHSHEVDRKAQKLNEQLRQSQKQLNAFERERDSIQSKHHDSESVLRQAKKDAELAQRAYQEKANLFDRLNSAEVWSENSQKWIKASKDEYHSDIDEYTHSDACYVMGPVGPYLIEHNNKPCVLLYQDDLEEYQGLTPVELLKNTISAMIFGLQMSNKPGLAEFAVVNEYSEDSSFSSSIMCYGKRTLDVLSARVDKMQADLQSETGFGNTVKTFNQNYSRQMGEKGITSQNELLRLLKKTLYVFILPTPDSDQAPMHHERLWEKVRGNCYDYGFVPMFLIPKSRWEAANNNESNHRTGFGDAVHQLISRAPSNVSIHEIPLNKFK